MFVANWLLTSTIAESVNVCSRLLTSTIAGPVNVCSRLLTSTIAGPVNVCTLKQTILKVLSSKRARYNHYMIDFLIFGVLILLSTIFQLYHGDQF